MQGIKVTENLHGDSIIDLPTDKTMPSHREIEVIDSVFQKHKSLLATIMIDAKDAIILGLLFALMASPFAEGALSRFFPSMGSPYMSILIRSIVFMIIYYILKNIYLVRR